MWERQLYFLSLIPLPLSFRKVPRRSVAYWVDRKNAMGISTIRMGLRYLIDAEI